MIDIDTTLMQSIDAHKMPVVICRIETQRTAYMLCSRYLNSDEVGALGGVSLWDGSVNTGDGGYFGGLPVSYVEARVLQFGSVEKSLVTNAKDLPASLSQGQIGAYSISCDNVDGWFSELLGDDRDEPLLAQRLKIYIGCKGDSFTSFMKRFDGEITQVSWDAKTCRITAEDQISVFPSIEAEAGVDVYAARGTGATHMAQDTFTAAQCANFLASDTWLFTSNLIKDDLTDFGVIFELENTRYYATVLQIGIDYNNFPYVTVGTDVETSFGTVTYTSTTALTASDISQPFNLRVYFDSGNSQVTFTVNGTSVTIAAATAYDRTGTFDNVIRLGNGFDGDIQNWIWNNTHYWTNNQGDNTLVDVPDVVGSLDITLTGGTWVAWPSI